MPGTIEEVTQMISAKMDEIMEDFNEFRFIILYALESSDGSIITNVHDLDDLKSVLQSSIEDIDSKQKGLN